MPEIHHLVPWFIVEFLLVLAVRSLGAMPESLLLPIKNVAALLTTISMAAPGLGVDIRTIARAGLRVSTAVTLSLIVLGRISLALIHLLHVS